MMFVRLIVKLLAFVIFTFGFVTLYEFGPRDYWKNLRGSVAELGAAVVGSETH